MLTWLHILYVPLEFDIGFYLVLKKIVKAVHL